VKSAFQTCNCIRVGREIFLSSMPSHVCAKCGYDQMLRSRLRLLDQAVRMVTGRRPYRCGRCRRRTWLTAGRLRSGSNGSEAVSQRLEHRNWMPASALQMEALSAGTLGDAERRASGLDSPRGESRPTEHRLRSRHLRRVPVAPPRLLFEAGQHVEHHRGAPVPWRVCFRFKDGGTLELVRDTTHPLAECSKETGGSRDASPAGSAFVLSFG